MRFSTGLPGINLYPPITNDWERSMQPGDYQLVARTADELGFHSLAIPEHIVIPNDMVPLMGPSWSHAMTAMSFVAGATSRIVVDSSVIVLPYHDPVVFAKAVATLDVLSGGRVRVSIGVGHAEREFEILRVPFHERGKVSDEYLDAIVELWTSDAPEFHGTYVDFADVAFEPKPVQRPHPPIWIGGNTGAARRRVTAHGDGWCPFPAPAMLAQTARTAEMDSGTLGEGIDDLRRRLEAVGRDPSTVDISFTNAEGGSPGADDFNADAYLSGVEKLAALGVTWLQVGLPGDSLAHALETIERFGKLVVAQAR